VGYPYWEVPVLGGGMVIALVATIHVLIAHFAVGAGILIALTESRIARRPSPVLRDFLRRFGKFILLFSFVAGALTGVGIWFSIGLVAPRATSLLIHNYVWGWAAEWCLFAIEIAAGYAYYFSFDRLSDGKRRALAWIYAWAAWGSLAIINGIICFMLTPGKWLATGAFWDGFFNPTYWPSLLLRTISCLSLAGIFAAIVANGSRAYDRAQTREIINHAAWLLAPLILMVPLAGWYFAMVPPQALLLLKGGAMVMTMFLAFGVAASTLIGLYAFVGLIWNRRYVNMETAVLLAAIAFIATGSMEFVREGIRKPWLIYDTLYSNGWTPQEAEALNKDGVLAHAPWLRLDGATADSLPPIELGRRVFKAQCAICHVIGGVNDVGPLIATWDKPLLEYNLERIHQLKPFMPPLIGTPKERAALAGYLLRLKEEQGGRLALSERPNVPDARKTLKTAAREAGR
jgi:cytochrome bd-type quinol oxidase subunit 1